MPQRKSDHTSPASPTSTLRTQHFVGHDNVDIVADVGGPETGLPIILLHGGGQTRHSWKALAKTLIHSEFRVINVDLRGHGDSGWSETGDYHLNTLVADLRLIIAQQSALPVVVGASLGGITALLAIGESLQPIARGIALVDIVPKIEQEGSDAILRFMAANPDGFATLDEAAAAVAAYLPHRPKPPSNAGLMKNLRPGKNGRLYWHWDPKILDERSQEKSSTDVAARMENAARNISVPALLVRGGKSDLVSMEGVKHFLKVIPHADFVDVKDASHMVAGDMNDVFSQAIVDFIKLRLQS